MVIRQHFSFECQEISKNGLWIGLYAPLLDCSWYFCSSFTVFGVAPNRTATIGQTRSQISLPTWTWNITNRRCSCAHHYLTYIPVNSLKDHELEKGQAIFRNGRDGAPHFVLADKSFIDKFELIKPDTHALCGEPERYAHLSPARSSTPPICTNISYTSMVNPVHLPDPHPVPYPGDSSQDDSGVESPLTTQNLDRPTIFNSYGTHVGTSFEYIEGASDPLDGNNLPNSEEQIPHHTSLTGSLSDMLDLELSGRLFQSWGEGHYAPFERTDLSLPSFDVSNDLNMTPLPLTYTDTHNTLMHALDSAPIANNIQLENYTPSQIQHENYTPDGSMDDQSHSFYEPDQVLDNDPGTSVSAYSSLEGWGGEQTSFWDSSFALHG